MSRSPATALLWRVARGVGLPYGVLVADPRPWDDEWEAMTKAQRRRWCLRLVREAKGRRRADG